MLPFFLCLAFTGNSTGRADASWLKSISSQLLIHVRQINSGDCIAIGTIKALQINLVEIREDKHPYETNMVTIPTHPQRV